MTPERVQRTYLVLILLQTLAASLIWGINTLFLLDAGLSLTGAFVANAAARGRPDPAKFAALAAGQAVAVAHVAAHELGAAAYAIRAAVASAPAGQAESARVLERDWQRERLPAEIRELVLDDQRQRSAICWNVFLILTAA